MLVSVALRLLGHTEYSSVDDVCFSLSTVNHLFGKKGEKSTDATIEVLTAIRKALDSIPALKRSLRGSLQKDDEVVPHIPLNEYMWFQDGGWGFWPGKVISIEDGFIVAQFSNKERCFIPLAQAKQSIRPFLHDFDKLTKMSTCRLAGFGDNMKKALEDLTSGPVHSELPESVRKVIIDTASCDRFSLRMGRVSEAIKKYLDKLHQMPLFLNIKVLVQKRIQKEAREKEATARAIEIEENRKRREEERRVLEEAMQARREEREKTRAEKEKTAALLEKERKAREKEEKAKAKKRAVNIMRLVDELEQSSDMVERFGSQRVRRSMISQSTASSANAATLTVQGGDTKHHEEANIIEYLRAFKALMRRRDRYIADGTKRKLSASSDSSDSGADTAGMDVNGWSESQLYMKIFEFLLMGGEVSDESIVYALEQDLPMQIVRMLLSRYAPTDLYKARHGKTLLHIAAEYDRHKAIAYLNAHWARRQELLKLLRRGSLLDLCDVKDSHKKTPVHSACETGSYKSLLALQKLGCSLDDRDNEGATPLLLCAVHNFSEGGRYLLRQGVDPTAEDKRGFSVLYYAMRSGCVLLGKKVFKDGCWLSSPALKEFVGDMSLGREPYRIILDSRPLEECREIYLTAAPVLENGSYSRGVDMKKENGENSINRESKMNRVRGRTGRPKKGSKRLSAAEKNMRSRREGGNSSAVEASRKEDAIMHSNQVSSNRGGSKKMNTEGNDVEGSAHSQQTRYPRRVRTKVDSYVKPSAVSESESSGSNSEGCSIDDGDSNSSATSPRSNLAGRYSNRVFALSNEVAGDILAIESAQWQTSDFMGEICSSSPAIVPRFVYATESYLGTPQELLQQYGQSNASYQCCSCEGDCATNPNCQCIMRNGQRNPYSSDGRFDFCKGKIFECGPYCSCNKSKCSLRLTQRGVSLPLVVCNMGSKGYGVMTTKVILKGSFVCTYVGERVSEDDLVMQEDEKIRVMNKSKKAFVTYAFEIHDGTDSFNVDSEYVGNVARFFNHSCNPNLRPIKVVGSSVHRTYPTMSFFALRRIEAGEELTWKYVSGVKAKSGQVCRCEAPNCVGYV